MAFSLEWALGCQVGWGLEISIFDTTKIIRILIFKSSLGYLTVNIPNTLVGKFVDFALAFSAYICGPLAREGAFQGQKVRWVSG